MSDQPQHTHDLHAWDDDAVPGSDYDRIASALASAESPVGIDAKHTHVLILHALDRIEKRLAHLERHLEGGVGRTGGAPLD
jgi:hypothetical protein